MSIRRRSSVALLALGAVVAVSALGAASASAQTVARDQFVSTPSFAFPAGTLCSFDVQASAYDVIQRTRFYDDAGGLTKKTYLVNDTDTWTANGNTLTGHEIFREEFDYAGGVLQQFIGTGLDSNVGKILLGPDGGVFMGTGVGRIVLDGNFQLVSFTGLPSVAMPANSTAFCAALS